jgi:hypothetical protein
MTEITFWTDFAIKQYELEEMEANYFLLTIIGINDRQKSKHKNKR